MIRCEPVRRSAGCGTIGARCRRQLPVIEGELIEANASSDTIGLPDVRWYGILQSTYRTNDGYGAMAHGVHLVHTTGFYPMA